MKAIFHSIIVALVLLGISTPGTSTDEGVFLNWDDLVVGEVIAQGDSISGECVFPLVSVATFLPHNAISRSATMEVQSDCSLMVVAIEENAPSENILEDYTGDPTENPQHLSANVFAVRQKEGSSLLDAGCITERAQCAAVSADDCASGAKSFANAVYMYGKGGKWDDLTRDVGELKFCSDGTNAHFLARDGACYAKTVDGWEELECDYDYLKDNSPTVESWGHGKFNFWGNSYTHTLYDKELGEADGDAWCVKDWSGTIVRGVDLKCTWISDVEL